MKNKQYWIKVLNHYLKNNYVNNGLTIPFLIGSLPRLERAESRHSIKDFIAALYLSKQGITMMTCPAIKQIVIAPMDNETKAIADKGTYKRFGGITITDDSFESVKDIDGIIAVCEASYSDAISKECFSFEGGKWVPFSATDESRLYEIFRNDAEQRFRNRNTTDEVLERIIKQGDGVLSKDLKPLWNTDSFEIDFFKQPENLDYSRLAAGYEVLPNVDFEVLLDNMFPERATDYREKKLYNSELDSRKIARVIGHWINGEKLIPPTITFEDRLDRNLFPAEGKHRINVAYCLGATKLPIIILSSQRESILSLLNPRKSAR